MKTRAGHLPALIVGTLGLVGCAALVLALAYRHTWRLDLTPERSYTLSTHARHILVRANENVSDAEAKAKIDRIRERIIGGAKFEDQAKVNSDDASSAKGGDLGWLSPGETVPDFEKAMDKLKIDEVSEPVRTPFGWHLIEVLARREQDVTKERQRAQARQAITQRKSEELFQEFIRQTRDRAYVEYKSDER